MSLLPNKTEQFLRAGIKDLEAVIAECLSVLNKGSGSKSFHTELLMNACADFERSHELLNILKQFNAEKQAIGGNNE